MRVLVEFVRDNKVTFQELSDKDLIDYLCLHNKTDINIVDENEDFEISNKRSIWDDVEVTLRLLEKNEELIKCIPAKKVKSEYEFFVVNKNGFNIANVEQTKELCDLAIKNKPGCFYLIEPRFYTKEMIMYVLKHIDYYDYIKYPFHGDIDICKLAINKNPRHILVMRSRTTDLDSLIEYALSKDGKLLGKLMQERFITCETKDIDKYYEAAIKQNGLALKYLPEMKRSKEYCELAVKSNPFALEYVSRENQTLEMCYEAINKDGRVFQYMYDVMGFLKKYK
jgi:hypothetical protein